MGVPEVIPLGLSRGYTAAVIHFRCGNCGQLMSVRPEFAGRAGNCPSCGTPFVTPNASTVDPAGGPATAPPAPSRPLASPPLASPSLAGPPTGHAPPQPHAPPPAHALPVPPTSPAVASRRAELEVVHGPDGFKGSRVSLDPSRAMVIGRDPAADVRVPSERVSRRHCQIQPMSGGFLLVDLGSSNGTLVNQARIDGQRPLQSGDYIQTGDCLFRFSQ